LSRFDFPLGVFTSELRTWLVHQTPFYLAKSEALTGGGGLSEDLMSKLRKRFEAVAYFNPKVHTNAHGRAQVSFTLPDNLTTYRAYVVALDRGGRFASAARPFLVTKDFYLEAGMPGFFTLGDTFTFQVAAFNNTAAAGPVSLEAAASGGVSLKAPADPATLPANTSVKLPVSGRTLAAGAATVQFTGKFGKLSDALELPLKINSPFRRETSVSFGSLSGAAELPAALPAYLKGPGQGAVGPQEIQAVLTLSGSPFLRLAPGLRYLLTYPYGCVEQTSSGVLALAALYPLVKAGQIPGVEPAAVEDYLKKGLARLATLQTDTGGFAYWPGYRRPHYWGSLYALAALTAAHSQGLAVAPPVRQKAVKYVKKQLEEGPASAGAKAFACYLLAQNRALERREFQEVQRDYGRLPREGKILLLLAAQQANLRPPAQLKEALKPLLGEAAAAAGESDDDFQARYRAPALALLAGAILLPDDPRTKEEALALLGGLDRQGYWTSTSDTGWALLALGRYFQGQTFSTEAVDLSVGQPGAPQGQRFTLDPKGFRTVGLDPELLLKHPVVQVKVPAGQTVLYKLELTAPRPDLAAAGVSRGLKVQRCLKNTDGSDVIKVGDLVRVTISLEAQKPVSYLLLEDPLPAGLVAVNTAFKTEEPLPAGAAEEEPDSGGDDDDFDYFPPGGAVRLRPNYFEIREDRVLAFRERLYTGTYQFEYVARAVCQGDFIWPATQAGAMYAPGIRGAAPQDKLTVQGR
jgi:uncharacterized protein YfaS (alpha-2-macroglobulin family)